MDEKMTDAERAAEAKRKAELAADIKRKDDVELKLFATQIGVDAEKYPKRADLEAAVELKAEQDAAAGRQKVRDMETEEAGKIASEDARRAPQTRVIRALNTEFCKDIPQDGRHGVFEPADGDLRFGGDYDVPNGKYRVAGSEWVFGFKKKKLVSAERATEQNNYGGNDVVSVD